MYFQKYISAILVSLFLINLAIADTSTSYEIDVSDSNDGGTLLNSTSYKANTAILGFVDGNFGYSSSYTLGSGLAYLELYCGNGILEFGEQCDDGNKVSGDGCSSTCKTDTATAVCGNSVIESGEQCDDGNAIGGDGCSSACLFEGGGGGGGGNPPPYSLCGNGVVEGIEQCDDGNATSGDGCDNSCKLEGDPDEEPKEEPEEEDEEEPIEDVDEDDGIFELPDEDDLKPSAEDEPGEYVRYPRAIKIKSRPEKRVRINNWGVPAVVTFYHIESKRIIGTVDVIMNDIGWSLSEEVLLPDGTYNIALKGLSHLTKVKRGVVIDESTHTIDFTFNDEFFLIAGDVHKSKDDFVNGLDISAAVNSLYTSDIHADLNLDGFVNGLDISIVVGNIYQYGEKLSF